ncbi:2-iminoacetate synthase ThiH [Fulvivirga sp. RKSG066]|uniref:2-iminoacetate synthase ThiH n=1 Tax=Fulvivirga aurantia TaxID=2529383 RepID=UPI0012BBF00A|nr:2-iminoacetate synthase ThiH [Fulvivirga aurantia]MTI22058.1 2-iminoacetate synthase ThiH [Fulvivirga aurantia]
MYKQLSNHTFSNVLGSPDWESIKASIYEKTARDVERAINKTERNLEDFKALISPAAAPFLEDMARQSHLLTQKRFGKTIQMYIPMYLSNECQNICTYCGFSLDVPIKRKTLSDQEILEEVKVIKSYGYDHILLVTGEANKTVGVEYFLNAIKLIKPYFSHIAIEVQPLDQEEYEQLIAAGVNTVLVYQETYHDANYKKHHPKGKKSNFTYRLETHDRLGLAGIHKMGLGVLIGLEDWRTDSFMCASHLAYLEKKYWQSKYSISFPRLRPCSGGVELKSVMSDRELVQLICAYRLWNGEVELSLSTRESERFRDNVIKLGITSMSADSKTDPGGYANPNVNLEQFEIDDKRSTAHILEVIRNQGYEPVFKDWDGVLQ